MTLSIQGDFFFLPRVYCKKSNKKYEEAFMWSYKIVKHNHSLITKQLHAGEWFTLWAFYFVPEGTFVITA